MSIFGRSAVSSGITRGNFGRFLSIKGNNSDAAEHRSKLKTKESKMNPLEDIPIYLKKRERESKMSPLLMAREKARSMFMKTKRLQRRHVVHPRHRGPHYFNADPDRSWIRLYGEGQSFPLENWAIGPEYYPLPKYLRGVPPWKRD